MGYRQITLQERYAIAVGRRAGRSLAAIARELGRHRGAQPGFVATVRLVVRGRMD